MPAVGTGWGGPGQNPLPLMVSLVRDPGEGKGLKPRPGCASRGGVGPQTAPGRRGRG